MARIVSAEYYRREIFESFGCNFDDYILGLPKDRQEHFKKIDDHKRKESRLPESQGIY